MTVSEMEILLYDDYCPSEASKTIGLKAQSLEQFKHRVDNIFRTVFRKKEVNMQF